MLRNTAKRTGIIILCGLLATVFLTAHAWAGSIKERMRDRLPVIVALKAKGVVGENNQGYLELRKDTSGKQDVVTAENKDRKVIYGKIAQQTGTDIKLVGQRRAAQIAEKASSGEWLQDAAGKWYRK